jgi:hypothetical protein
MAGAKKDSRGINNRHLAVIPQRLTDLLGRNVMCQRVHIIPDVHPIHCGDKIRSQFAGPLFGRSDFMMRRSGRVVGSTPASASHSLSGVHLGRKSERSDLEDFEGRDLASSLARDEGRIEPGDRCFLPKSVETYRSFPGKVRLFLARRQNTFVTSTFMIYQIQILVCRIYRFPLTLPLRETVTCSRNHPNWFLKQEGSRCFGSEILSG